MKKMDPARVKPNAMEEVPAGGVSGADLLLKGEPVIVWRRFYAPEFGQ
jgi:hypothetical protein